MNAWPPSSPTPANASAAKRPSIGSGPEYSISPVTGRLPSPVPPSAFGVLKSWPDAVAITCE
jgi:hypothetical protein